MRILGFPVPFTGERQKALNSVPEMGRGGWWPIIREPFTGAWQRNISIDNRAVEAHHANFTCKTLIASDIAKLRVKYVEQDKDKIWFEDDKPAYSPVLRRPNHYQTRIQFWESWMLSKLSNGNTYVFKKRDDRNVVVGLYILDPTRCRPMLADDGSVFYELEADNLSGIEDKILVPAREIIHDRFNCIFHRLIGTPPVFASGYAMQQGLNIQSNSIRLFENNSSPGGILTAPGQISEPTAKRLKDDWEQNFSGRNVGRVAVLGDGLKFEKMSLTAVEGQLIEQLRWTAEVVCSTYHIPAYKVGVGPPPSYNNVQAQNIDYYTNCLQVLIEAAEELLDAGLGIRRGAGTEFDLDGLLRMDSVTQVTAERDAVGAGIKSPNEARRRFDLKPVEGGESPYLQEQNFSLAALAKRDAMDDPWAAKSGAAPASAPSAPESAPQIDAVKTMASFELQLGNPLDFGNLILLKGGVNPLNRGFDPNQPRDENGQWTDGGGDFQI